MWKFIKSFHQIDTYLVVSIFLFFVVLILFLY